MKAVRKKREPSRKARKSMPAAEGFQCFWIHDGPVLRDFRDLARALDEMTDEQFAHHVNAEKNDFAVWVKEVLGETVCANALSRARSRQKTKDVLRAQLKKYV